MSDLASEASTVPKQRSVWAEKPWSAQHPFGFSEDAASEASTVQQKKQGVNYEAVVTGGHPWDSASQASTIPKQRPAVSEQDKSIPTLPISVQEDYQDLTNFYIIDKQKINTKQTKYKQTFASLQQKTFENTTQNYGKDNETLTKLLQKPDKTKRKVLFQKQRDTTKHETAANYAAIDQAGEFGLIPLDALGNFTAHARRGKDPSRLLGLRPGDRISVVTRRGVKGQVRVAYASRSRYFSPGQAVRSVTLGLNTADWLSLQ